MVEGYEEQYGRKSAKQSPWWAYPHLHPKLREQRTRRKFFLSHYELFVSSSQSNSTDSQQVSVEMLLDSVTVDKMVEIYSRIKSQVSSSENTECKK